MSKADDYAASRQNIFFTADSGPPPNGNNGDLTGQCVTLLKWFFNDCVPGFSNPFAARGNAKDVGHTLVAQGLAVEVAWADRRPGDVICYEYGTYGHIALQLSGGRVFEENVNWSGVKSMVVDGGTVYASRIGLENEAWRSTKNPHVYRLNGYNDEGEDMKVDANNLKYLYMGIYGQDPNTPVSPTDPEIGQDYSTTTERILDYANRNGFAYWQYRPAAEKQITDLTGQVEALKQQLANGGGGFTATDRATLNWIQKAIASIFKINI